MNPSLQHAENWPELARKAQWSVSKLATLCGVSPRTLERHFLKTHGQSPKEWLICDRKKQARELLSTGASVKEAAFSVGYSHASTFSREFKKQAGQRPHDLVKPLSQTPAV